MRQTLIEARTLGITDVLVTCDKDNIGSAKVITRNGGELSGEAFMDEHETIVQHYWIKAR